MIFALVGNQNCGKTTLFNRITGSEHHTGNFPGVTVEKKYGSIVSAPDCTAVDLPGTYSLSSLSADEKITCDFLMDSRPDAIMNVVDASNAERNLYLTLQLLETGIPMVIALNMMDEVRNNGGYVNVRRLSERLGVPVIPVSAAKNEGIDELVEGIIGVSERKLLPKVINYGNSAVRRSIGIVRSLIGEKSEKAGISSSFAAAKLIWGDKDIIRRLSLSESELRSAEDAVLEMERELSTDRNTAFADMRYSYIERICRETIVKPEVSKEHKRSVRIDRLLTGKYTAIPLFLGIILLIFFLTFNIIGPFLSGLMSYFIGIVTEQAEKLLTLWAVDPIVSSLVIDGIFTGVGSVLGFLPVIVTLFFFLSILEDTGYMARVAFIMDKPMRMLGLSGRSFVPLLIGFGCSVPAIMATRTLSSERDRRLTVLLIPFMSCSAKIPVYALLTSAFFKEQQAFIMLFLYLIGIVAGIFLSLILNRVRYKSEPVPFVMELPDYRFPTVKGILLLVRNRAKDFVRKAFTVIFISSVAIWFLRSFDLSLSFVSDGSESLLASIGRLISPALEPVGLGDWRICAALITGFTAKETVISTLAVLTGADINGAGAVLATLFSQETAISLLIFTLLYTPCVAALAAMKTEFNSGVKAVLASVFQCAVAWGAAFLFGRPTLFIPLLSVTAVFITVLIFYRKGKNRKGIKFKEVHNMVLQKEEK